MLFPHPGAWGCFPRPGSSLMSLRPAVAGQSLSVRAVPTDFTARAWPGGGGLGPAGSFPSASAGLGLRFPNGGSITFWPAGRLAGGLSGSRPLPSRLPSCSYPGLWPPGSAGGPAAWMFGDFYWRLHQDEGRGGPWGLPEPLYWSRPSRRAGEQRFPGESGFSAGLAPRCLCVWLGSAWPGLF